MKKAGLVTALMMGALLCSALPSWAQFQRYDYIWARTTNGAGSGIGLTIARAIVTAHHGRLLGRSEGPGTGANFEITLPIADHVRSHSGSS